jgi:hypothetical protein
MVRVLLWGTVAALVLTGAGRAPADGAEDRAAALVEKHGGRV